MKKLQLVEDNVKINDSSSRIVDNYIRRAIKLIMLFRHKILPYIYLCIAFGRSRFQPAITAIYNAFRSHFERMKRTQKMAQMSHRV